MAVAYERYSFFDCDQLRKKNEKKIYQSNMDIAEKRYNGDQLYVNYVIYMKEWGYYLL